VNADTAAKMRRLAQDYAEEEVETICSLVVKHRSRFGPTHLLIALRVAGSNRRDKLVQKAVREGWSTSRLERAAQATKGERRGHVGRKPRVPDDPKERLLALDALAEKWCRWCAAAGDGLPKEVKALVSLATTAVLEVQNAVKKQFPDTNTGKKSKTAPAAAPARRQRPPEAVR
jgi:hypothetical protein